MVEQDPTAVVREGGDHVRLQLVTAFRLRIGGLRGFEILQHRSVQFGPAGRAMPRQ